MLLSGRNEVYDEACKTACVKFGSPRVVGLLFCARCIMGGFRGSVWKEQLTGEINRSWSIMCQALGWSVGWSVESGLHGYLWAEDRLIRLVGESVV